jgi:hypothetical protein
MDNIYLISLPELHILLEDRVNASTPSNAKYYPIKV